MSLFSCKLFFDSSVEEEGYVGVFLGFGNVALRVALGTEPFCENVCHLLRGEGDVEGELRVVG